MLNCWNGANAYLWAIYKSNNEIPDVRAARHRKRTHLQSRRTTKAVMVGNLAMIEAFESKAISEKSRRDEMIIEKSRRDEMIIAVLPRKRSTLKGWYNGPICQF